MFYHYAADAVLLIHLAFILFVVFGGLLTIGWRGFPFIHLPAVGWGVFVELTGRICPLTSLENFFLIKAGTAGYGESFVGHYLLAAIYPDGLTRETQYYLGALVLTINFAIYRWLFYYFRRKGSHA